MIFQFLGARHKDFSVSAVGKINGKREVRFRVDKKRPFTPHGEKWGFEWYCEYLVFTFRGEEEIRQCFVQRPGVRCPSASNGGRGIPEAPAIPCACDWLNI